MMPKPQLPEKEMATEVIRDARHHRIGTIETDSGGNKVARDRNHVRVGQYDRAASVTRDRNYRVVGTGNQLSTLIADADR